MLNRRDVMHPFDATTLRKSRVADFGARVAVPQGDVGCAGAACERRCRQGKTWKLVRIEALDDLREGSVVADR